MRPDTGYTGETALLPEPADEYSIERFGGKGKREEIGELLVSFWKKLKSWAEKMKRLWAIESGRESWGFVGGILLQLV